MIQIAILEDEKKAADTLSNMILNYSREHSLLVHITCHQTAKSLLQSFLQIPADIAFLDIYLDDSARAIGMETALRLKTDYPQCKLVFATTSDTHAIESYSVRAAYYLQKPLDYDKFCAAMQTACAAMLRDNLCMRLSCQGEHVKFPLKEIYYMDSLSEQAVLYTTTGTLQLDGLVRDNLALLLTHDRFLQCNRNLVVNMDWITATETDSFLLKTGERLPIRRNGRAEIKAAYLAYRMRSIEGGQGI